MPLFVKEMGPSFAGELSRWEGGAPDASTYGSYAFMHGSRTAPIARWIDWNDIPLVLAIARSGSLSRAAPLLGLSQPTLSRRLDSCEQKVGVEIFSRGPVGVVLTSRGRELLAIAEQINGVLYAAQAALWTPAEQPTGTVRITASDWLCQTVLPPMIAALTRVYRGIQIELIADAGLQSLPGGEADIALRPRRFSQNTVWQTSVGTVAFGLYASAGYLADHGHPSSKTFFAGHRILQLVTGGQSLVADAVWLKRVARSAEIVVRGNGRVLLARCALADQGIACLPRYLAERMEGLRLIQVDEEPPARKLWIGTSESGRRFSHIQVVRDYLCSGLRELSSEL